MTATEAETAASTGRPRVLVAGIGNIFLGDDAFGVEVARRLSGRPQPAGVRVVDFGIRGLDLAYALLDGCDAAVLVDAAPRGGPPGTLYVIEPQLGAADGPGADGPAAAGPVLDGHSMDPAKVLRTVAALGGRPGRVLVVGCEPAPPAAGDDGFDDMSMGLSDPVRAAVDEAVSLVESLARDLLAAESSGAGGGAAAVAPPIPGAAQHNRTEVRT